MEPISKQAIASVWKALPVVGFATLASGAVADTVNLRGVDGTVDLTGELIGFDNESYFLQTPLGDLRVAADKVTCIGAACPIFEQVRADVVVGGSDVVAEGLMPLLLAGFATHQGAEARTQGSTATGLTTTTITAQDGFGEVIGTFAISSGDSGDAFTGLQDASLGMGLSARRITPDEARALSAAGAGNMIDPQQEHIVAIDSLVVIVNRSNPVDQLSVQQLADIYAGRISNWQSVGGPDQPIEVVTLADEGTTEVFQTGVYGDATGVTIRDGFVAQDNVEAAIYVDENPNSIAYVGFAFKRGQKPLNLISECGIGTTPDAFSVKTEEYALFRRLYLYTADGTSTELMDDFVTFATSPAADNVILQSGFINLSIEQVAQSYTARPDDATLGSFETGIINAMASEMAQSDRLSSTFRFRTGSTQLDPRGLDDLDRLIAYLDGAAPGTEVTFVGFADSVGAFEPNITLSESRAAQVRDALLAKASDQLSGITFNVAGYGEVAPAACNTNESGRAINRRVETWIKTP